MACGPRNAPAPGLPARPLTHMSSRAGPWPPELQASRAHAHWPPGVCHRWVPLCGTQESTKSRTPTDLAAPRCRWDGPVTPWNEGGFLSQLEFWHLDFKLPLTLFSRSPQGTRLHGPFLLLTPLVCVATTCSFLKTQSRRHLLHKALRDSTLCPAQEAAAQRFSLCGTLGVAIRLCRGELSSCVYVFPEITVPTPTISASSEPAIELRA